MYDVKGPGLTWARGPWGRGGAKGLGQIWAGGPWERGGQRPWANLGRRPLGEGGLKALGKFGPEALGEGGAEGPGLIWAGGPGVLRSPLPKADRATSSYAFMSLVIHHTQILNDTCSVDDKSFGVIRVQLLVYHSPCLSFINQNRLPGLQQPIHTCKNKCPKA